MLLVLESVAIQRACDRPNLSLLPLAADNNRVDVARLRTETRSEHEAVEALLPLMADDLTRAQYADVLCRMYGVVHGWETWATRNAPEQLQTLLSDRQRSPLMKADLQSLGHTFSESGADVVQQRLTDHFLSGNHNASAVPADFLGAMYVMEGSTLGGQYIARHVEAKFAFQGGEGDAYFRGYEERTGSMWNSFKEHLIALPDAETERVIAAARFMFDTFAIAIRDNGARAEPKNR